ncbi:hypothetical protein [Acetobacter persici]|uniref:hypothetical protein n=1 Tax=Acetobacter persici TaxID=1076596 RepID=UPI0012FD2FF3|nr:hypothetical protein [Acetobacter persici]
MTWQFSKATGFSKQPKTGVSAGCVAVSDADYAGLFAAQSKRARITPAADGSPQAVDGEGAVIDISTIATAGTYAKPYTPTLADKAITALASAKAYTQSEYTDFGDAIPDAWKTYLKALRDIANGTDRTAVRAAPAASHDKN